MLSKVKRPRAGAPTPLQLARLLRSAAVDKKAWDAVVMDVRDKTSVADYFVVCEGVITMFVEPHRGHLVGGFRSASSGGSTP